MCCLPASDRRGASLSRLTAELPPCRVLWLLLSAAGAAAVRHPVSRAAHAGLFGILCSDVLESVADLSGVMGSDHHAAGNALRVLIPPPYAHPVYSRAACGLSLLPHHADGAERRRQVDEKPRAYHGGQLLAHPVQSMEFVLVPFLLRVLQLADQLSVSAVARGAERPGVRGSYYEKRAGTRDHIAAAVCALVTASYLVLERSMA